MDNIFNCYVVETQCAIHEKVDSIGVTAGLQLSLNSRQQSFHSFSIRSLSSHALYKVGYEKLGWADLFCVSIQTCQN